MKFPFLFLPLIPLICLVANAQESPPVDAQKYHEALLKHPHNPTVFSRFYDAWLDAKSIESLEAFLKNRAETHGGIDYVILARYQLQRGQEPNAMASFNKAIEKLTNDPALLLERANLLVRSNDFEAARTDLEAVVKLGNDALSIEASKLIGQSYLREGNPDAAIQAWEKIITHHPKNEDLLEDLVELASSAEQPEQALKYSDKLIAASSDPYKKALRLIRRGELLAKSGESDKAISLWSETLSQTGEGSWLEREIFAHIEQSYRRLDRIDLLTSKLVELATAHPRRLLIHRELAKLEASSGNIDSAIGRFREVLRRSPGELELREEFIRLLITSERFDDASAEIGKMLSTTPENPELHLRLAELAFQKSQLNPDLDKKTRSTEILKSLETALKFLDPTEGSGLRIANMMIRYDLGENGEALLKKLSTQPNASSAPAEALATEYTRTKRPAKALEILTDLAKSPDAETVIRATNNMAPLSKAEIPFDILLSRLPDFPNNNSYIAALIQASLAAKKPADAIPSALKLVRSSKLASEIQDATKLASTVISAAEKIPDITAELSKIESRSIPETCLLASLLEIQKLHEQSDAILKNSTDPIILRFYASLLSVRGDFPTAIATLNRLSQTSSDNSASYFKELSDLQLRSGDSASSLKTIEQWKIAAPTDKTPWTIAIRLLRESGNYQEAIETARRALTRFNNDEDLTSGLADLYQQTGAYPESERIYWKLYDQAPDSSAQSRWAARLATLAHSKGNTEELKEKFVQRSRSNNQSIGPILALVELARVTQNREAELEHLYQALRIKPSDIDIRLQISATEKQIGNLDKQISILIEGIDKDSTGRIRTSLAQAYIDQGHIMKGMHMLRVLSGERASDPRFIESAANSIASAGMLSEAIQYIEESLPPNSDWRARYFLADLLQKDGREAEAVTILISLMDAKDEIQGLTPNSNFQRIQENNDSQEYYYYNLINIVSQEVYNHKNHSRSSSRQQSILPSSLVELRFRAQILLAFISNLGNQAIKEKIATANIKELNFISDIIACQTDNGIDYIALLEKHPTHQHLIKMVIQQGRLTNPNTGVYYTSQKAAAINKLLLESPTLSQELRTQIIINQLQTDPKNDEVWNQVFSLIEKANNTENSNLNYQVLYSLRNFITQQKEDIPSKHFPKIRELFLNSKNGNSNEIEIYALLGEIETWTKAVNKIVAEHYRQISQHLKAGNQEIPEQTIETTISQFGFSPQVPQIRSLPLTSIPIHYFQNISSENFDTSWSSSQGTIAAKDLLKHLDRIESPVLRAWIAILSTDQKAIQKTLSAKVSDLEANDIAILKIWLDIEAGRNPEACRGLVKLSNNKSFHNYHIHWAKTSFLAIVMDIPAEKRNEFLPTAREIIETYSPPSTTISSLRNSGHHSLLLQTSKRLGFEDLVVKFSPPANPQQIKIPKPKNPTKASIGNPAIIVSGRSRPPKPQQRALNPVERMQQLSSEGKHSAAALEFLNYAQTQKKQGYEFSYILSNIKISEEVQKEIMSISDPGSNPSLSKRLNYAEICLAFKETDTALTILRALSAERPFDAMINAQLAFNLPEQEIDTAANLLKQCANSSSLYTILNNHSNQISRIRTNSTTFQYFSLITKFLEISDPDKFETQAFNEINNQINYFINGNNLTSIPSLIRPSNTPQKENEEILKHREIAHKLTTAMLRHPLLAESGFQYMRAAKWIEDPNKIDELARRIILLEIQQTSLRRHNSRNLLEYSSANWICDRLKKSKTINEVIPADFLTSVEESDPILATLIKSYFTIKTTKDIASFWDSGAMQDNGYQSSRSTIQKAILEKIANTPGAADFFISRIKSISQNQILNSRSNRTGESNHINFIRAAIASCKGQNEATVNNLCKTIIDKLYGENFNFSISNYDTNSQQYQKLSYANSLIDSILNHQTLDLDPVTAIRVFQAFDSHRIPMQNYYWIQNIFQKIQFTDPNKTIELFESMGFLKDTSTWQPLAYSSINNHYDQSTGTSTYSITRNLLIETLFQNLSYNRQNPEFFDLFEKRKPQTFGSHITAAFLSNDQKKRERLILAAFKHASPQLSKSSPKQIDDLNLLTNSLSAEAIDTLPSILQLKSKERNAQIVATILKDIDQQFKQIDANPTIEPFGMIDSYIQKIAQYDLDKATEIFLRTHTIYKANISLYSNHTAKLHQRYFNNLLRSFSTDTNILPKSGIKFYRAVLDSPNGSDFGYTSEDQNSSYLSNLGYNLVNRLIANIPDKTHPSLSPWLIINQLPEEVQNDALAAMICHTLHNQNSNITITELTPLLEKAEGLSKKTRDIIISCAHITNLRNLTPENRITSFQHLSKLLNNPTFSPNTRTQIALSALRAREIFSLPGTAEMYSEFFTDLSKQDQSMVNSLVINSLTSISNTEIPAESIPHLKTMSEAFWDNANSTKSGGHTPLAEPQALSLFLLAIKASDVKNTELIFSKIRTFSVGNQIVITNLILNDQFDLAEQLLPDESASFFSNQSIYHSLPLLEKLIEFSSKSKKPEQVLRLECHLINKAHINQSKGDLAKKLQERKQQLITTYLKNPPKSLQNRCEILSTIQSPYSPVDPALEKEICDVAAKLDPKQALSNWHEKYKSNAINGLSEEHPFKIICTAAMIHFLNGDPTLFISTCEAITEISNRIKAQDEYKLVLMIASFIDPALLTTAQAVALNKTESFSKSIKPLRNLALTLCKFRYETRFEQTLALHDFISHWENQPEDLTKEMNKIGNDENKSARNSIAFPREHFPFITSLGNIQSQRGSSSYGPNTDKLLIAILSKPSLGNILPTKSSWLSRMENNESSSTLAELAKSLPETLSPEGRTLLKLHNTMMRIRGNEAVESYQSILKDIPDNINWESVRIDCKLRLAGEMLRLKMNIPEIRGIFDSIDQEKVSNYQKSQYANTLRILKDAEANQQ